MNKLANLPAPEEKKKPKHSVCDFLAGDIACKSGKCNLLLFVVDIDFREREVDVDYIEYTVHCRMVDKHNANNNAIKSDDLEIEAAAHSNLQYSQ